MEQTTSAIAGGSTGAAILFLLSALVYGIVRICARSKCRSRCCGNRVDFSTNGPIAPIDRARQESDGGVGTSGDSPVFFSVSDYAAYKASTPAQKSASTHSATELRTPTPAVAIASSTSVSDATPDLPAAPHNLI